MHKRIVLHQVCRNRLFHLVQGSTDRAVTAFSRALEIDPALASAERSLGLALTRLGRKAEAAQHFRRYLQLRPDADDADIVYAEYQGGNLSRIDISTGESKDIKPWAKEGEEELRYNWNAPIAVSRHTPGTIYFGSQYLHRSRDRGETWETISPDLTTDDDARQRQKESGGLTIDNSTAENNTTIFSIAEYLTTNCKRHAARSNWSD